MPKEFHSGYDINQDTEIFQHQIIPNGQRE